MRRRTFLARMSAALLVGMLEADVLWRRGAAALAPEEEPTTTVTVRVGEGYWVEFRTPRGADMAPGDLVKLSGADTVERLTGGSPDQLIGTVMEVHHR